MFGFGGHFLTKSRRYSVTFRILRDNRVLYRRTQEPPPGTDTTLVVNVLAFACAVGTPPATPYWPTPQPRSPRERHRIGREEITAA
jgi:hypothetical protein